MDIVWKTHVVVVSITVDSVEKVLETYTVSSSVCTVV
jgi:hypothetical protein